MQFHGYIPVANVKRLFSTNCKRGILLQLQGDYLLICNCKEIIERRSSSCNCMEIIHLQLKGNPTVNARILFSRKETIQQQW